MQPHAIGNVSGPALNATSRRAPCNQSNQLPGLGRRTRAQSRTRRAIAALEGLALDRRTWAPGRPPRRRRAGRCAHRPGPAGTSADRHSASPERTTRRSELLARVGPVVRGTDARRSPVVGATLDSGPPRCTQHPLPWRTAAGASPSGLPCRRAAVRPEGSRHRRPAALEQPQLLPLVFPSPYADEDAVTPAPPRLPGTRARCPQCGRCISLTPRATIALHKNRTTGQQCAGSLQEPDPATLLPPWHQPDPGPPSARRVKAAAKQLAKKRRQRRRAENRPYVPTTLSDLQRRAEADRRRAQHTPGKASSITQAQQARAGEDTWQPPRASGTSVRTVSGGLPSLGYRN